MKGIAFTPLMNYRRIHGNKRMTRRLQKSDLPPYKAGEVLYVKERHRVIQFDEEWADLQYGDTGQICRCYYDKEDYLALTKRKPVKGKTWGRWLPARYMRKNFHRSRIRVKEVRSELLWDITREDAIAEGIEIDPATGFYPDYTSKTKWSATPELSFISLFAAINGMGAIKAEQRVWVIEFETIL